MLRARTVALGRVVVTLHDRLLLGQLIALARLAGIFVACGWVWVGTLIGHGSGTPSERNDVRVTSRLPLGRSRSLVAV